jgi:Rrf2 family iron-sulfur cluster assembly transcriptional regulator
MISRTAKYAFNILGYLVRTRGTKTSGEQIANETGIPANYLSKILNQLRKGGLVSAEKGWGGGFEIRKDALDRPIRDVLAIIDGAESVDGSDCVFGLAACDEENPCPLHSNWERVLSAYDDMLNSRKIVDLSS